MPKVTIMDIAKEANVSKTTVSRYLNARYDSMSEDTRLDIERIIAKFNYYPNASARSLKSRKSRLIGIMMSITDNTRLVSQLLQGICSQLKASGYNPVMYDAPPGEENKIVSECLGQSLDGLLVVPSSLDFSVYDQAVDAGMPMVLVDRYMPTWKYDAVYVNHDAAVKQAMQHLYDSGFEKIAFLTANQSPVSTKLVRQKAFVDFVQSTMGEDGDSMVKQITVDTEAVEKTIADFSRQYPKAKKAVFAVDSDVLFAVLSAVERLRLRMPKDIGVCGYDSWGWAALVPPGVTSIIQPINDMAVKAVQLLLKRLDGGPARRVSRVKLAASLIVRGSTTLR